MRPSARAAKVARAATASAPRRVHGARPRSLSAGAARRAASWVSVKRCRPKVARCRCETRRTRSSTASRDAPTSSTSVPAGAARTKSIAASSRATAEGESTISSMGPRALDSRSARGCRRRGHGRARRSAVDAFGRCRAHRRRSGRDGRRLRPALKTTRAGRHRSRPARNGDLERALSSCRWRGSTRRR